MRGLAGVAAVLVAGSWSVAATGAAITYQATNISGSTWRYDYTVANDAAAPGDIRGFDILFDPALTDESSITIVSSPAIATDWDEILLASGAVGTSSL